MFDCLFSAFGKNPVLIPV